MKSRLTFLLLSFLLLPSFSSADAPFKIQSKFSKDFYALKKGELSEFIQKHQAGKNETKLCSILSTSGRVTAKRPFNTEDRKAAVAFMLPRIESPVCTHGNPKLALSVLSKHWLRVGEVKDILDKWPDTVYLIPEMLSSYIFRGRKYRKHPIHKLTKEDLLALKDAIKKETNNLCPNKNLMLGWRSVEAKLLEPKGLENYFEDCNKCGGKEKDTCIKTSLRQLFIHSRIKNIYIKGKPSVEDIQAVEKAIEIRTANGRKATRAQKWVDRHRPN